MHEHDLDAIEANSTEYAGDLRLTAACSPGVNESALRRRMRASVNQDAYHHNYDLATWALDPDPFDALGIEWSDS